MNLFRCSGEIKISGFVTIRKEQIVETLNIPGDICYNGGVNDVKAFFQSVGIFKKGNWIIEIDEPLFNSGVRSNMLRRKYRIILSVTAGKITINSYTKIFDKYCNKAKKTRRAYARQCYQTFFAGGDSVSGDNIAGGNMKGV